MAEPAAKTIACALCGAAVPATSYRTVNSHPACQPCIIQIENELAAQTPTAASFGPAIALGLLGALLGAAVWAAIAAATDFAIGYIAVLVGFLAGLGVKIGAGPKRGKPLQILAACLALVGLVVAKYAVFAIVAVKYANQQGASLGYLDARVFELFTGVIGKLLSPFDLLWIFLAFGAAYRVPAPKKIQVL